MKNLVSLFLFFIVITHIYSQPSFIPLSVEYALFRGAEKQIYLEVYLAFNDNFLTYDLQGDKYIAEYIASTEIFLKDSLIDRKIDRRISEVDSSLQKVNVRKFVNVFKFFLDPGFYLSKIQVRDQNSTRTGEYEFDVTVAPFTTAGLMLSDIQLCSKITSDTLQSEFFKNSFLTIPNPDNLFSLSNPVVYYYAELYNLSYSLTEPGSYQVHTNITDLQGNIVKDYQTKSHKKPGESAVIVGGHNIVTLPAATYYLNLEIKDEQTQETIRGSKKFLFYKPGDQTPSFRDSSAALTTREASINIYLEYSEKDLEREFSKAEQLSTAEERQIFKNLDLEGKRIFLAKFWQKLDNNPQTEVNEFKNQYLELVKYAENNFGAMRKEGWKTDRGRVLLTYGVPSEIERYYMEIDKKPHEIWHYQQLEGGVIFVFADLTGFGEFDLLHSTYSRELHQPNWERLVVKSTGTSDDDQQY